MPGAQPFGEQNNNNEYLSHEQPQHGDLNDPLPGTSANSYFFPTPDFPEQERHQKPMHLPPDSYKDLKLKTKGLSAQHRKERERVLSNTPVETLVHNLIEKEFEARESKKLLRTAIARLEHTTQRAVKAEQGCKSLEATHALQKLNVSQGVIDAQQQAAKAQQDITLYKLQIDHMTQQLRRAQDIIKIVEDERDDAERSASKARAAARKFNDERLALFAREEGRRQGFEEGMQQGRLAIFTAPEMRRITARAHTTPPGSVAAFIEDAASSPDAEESRGHRSHNQHDIPRGIHSKHGSNGTGTHRTPRPRHASLDSAPYGQSHVSRSRAASSPHTQPQQVQVNGTQHSSVGATSQDSALRQELEAAREQAEALKKEMEQREAIRMYDLQKVEHMEREAEAERERIKIREAEIEREREAVQQRGREREVEVERTLKIVREREAEREREREWELQMIKLREAELEREREQQKEREREKEHQLELERQREQERQTRERGHQLELERQKEQERKARERERELELERQREQERKAREREHQLELERQREQERKTREREHQLKIERQREQERKAREREEREREVHEREREMQREKERLDEQREKERLNRQREQERLSRQREQERFSRQREQERLDREREQERIDREREQEERERFTRLPYLPMPPPPTGIAGIVPPPPILHAVPEIQAFHTTVHQPQQVQSDLRRTQRRRSSDADTTRSPSSSASVSQLEIITFPSSAMNGNGRGDEMDYIRPHGLAVIPEANESRTSIATAPSPRWLQTPPPDYTQKVLRGQDLKDVERWRRSTSDHVSFSPGSSGLGSQPRGRVANRPATTDLYRTPSSSSTSRVDITIVPPSRPPSPSGTSHHQVGDFEGYLSPKHGPPPLPMESTQQPVIPEYVDEPPPGFVPFAPPTEQVGGNGNKNGYSAPRSPIYANMPLTTSAPTWPSRDSAPATPRQIYSMPFAGAGPGQGLGPPVVPSSPRDRHVQGSGTPHHRSIPLGSGGGATPMTGPQDLPTSFSGVGGGETLRRIPSNGSMSSHNKYSSTTHFQPDDKDEDEDEVTRRNTLANANAGVGGMRVDTIPNPPSTVQKKKKKRR